MAQPADAKAAAPTTALVSNISNTRLNVIIAGLWLCLFMSAMDTTIITTALIKISSNFHALEQATWLVTAYLLTYNSCLMITAKLSDIWGLKAVLLVFNIVFLVFSMACGGASSMTQLIVFRAFQGIGGSALYSLVFVAIMKLIVPEKVGFYSGVVSSVFALANLLGPILGGVITDHTSWRWIFWINAPIIGTAILILFFAMPGLNDNKSTKERLRSFDGIGGILSVCWSIPLLFALQEAGVHYEWKSGVIIGTLAAGVVLFFLFGFYEAWVSYKLKIDAVFPIRFLTNPTMALLLLSMFLLGMPFYVVFIQLPQRFQGVNFTSAERAGILLLPVTMLTPVGAIVGGALMFKVGMEYMLLVAMVIVCVGTGLLSSLPLGSHFSNATYAYEIIIGFGLGLASPPYFPLMYTSVEEKDASVGTGAINMMRTLGGSVAVAICSALHHSVLKDDLSGFLNPEQIEAVEASSAFIAQLPEQSREKLGRVFGKSYNKQFQVMLAFTLLNFFVVIALMWVRKKKGIFGTMPVRREGNEFMEKGDGVADEDPKVPSAAKDETQANEVLSDGDENKDQEQAHKSLDIAPVQGDGPKNSRP